MTDVFLSYSSKDRERVRPVHDALSAMGYGVFWDVETPPGENWDQWIRGHIAKARVVIVFWTQNSAGSPNVQHEAAIARESKKLVAAQLEVMKAIDFPMGFYTVQAPQLHDWDGHVVHAGFSSLVRAIQTRLKVSPEQAKAVADEEDAADVAELRRRSIAGDSSAQTELGYRYQRGIGVSKNAHEAVRLWKMASEQGNVRSQTNLGTMYFYGQGGLAKDDQEAVLLFKLAANRGYAQAQANLGYMYAEGLGGLTKDPSEAVWLNNLAADQNLASGFCNLADMYAVGNGVPKNPDEAFRLYQVGMERGHARSQLGLGLMHWRGEGVALDFCEARRLFGLAAAQGLDEAQYWLGLSYEEAKCTTVNFREAARLYQLAAEQGYAPATIALKRLGAEP